MSEPFIAEVRIFAGNFAPRGWAFCDGQLLPIAENTALFSLVGATYGGDARTTLGLPNLQGRTAMHPGRGPGLTARRLGEQVGVETVTLAESQIPAHSHALRGTASAGDKTAPSAAAALAQPRGGRIYSDQTASLEPLASYAASTTGGGQSHNNMQPYIVMNFIIALMGLYPSRS